MNKYTHQIFNNIFMISFSTVLCDLPIEKYLYFEFFFVKTKMIIITHTQY